MSLTVQIDYEDVLRRIKKLFQDSRTSVREMAFATAHLEPPETLHHSALSQILGQKFNRRLSLTHALIITKILHVPPISMLYDFISIEEARRADALIKRFIKLSPLLQDDVLAAATRSRSSSASSASSTD
ncbi:hypothetical protein [Nevskia sp.]|uniref:hypothetical protein n=1 Tax=Nevskia sp. TaxID=1929292 RepID=UPI0026002BD9|nr:hypothetical protein [Nevskia sp.]